MVKKIADFDQINATSSSGLTGHAAMAVTAVFPLARSNTSFIVICT